MTDAAGPADLQTIREALEFSDSEFNGGIPHADSAARKKCREALAALDRLEGLVLPELPKGWHLYDCNSSPYHGYVFGLMRWNNHVGKKEDGFTMSANDVVRGEGLTPRSAVLCAVKKIGGAG